MNLIPTNELTEFLTLPADVRTEVESWHTEFQRVAKPIQLALRAAAAKLGVSYKTAVRKYYAWKKSGGSWRTLINRAKVPQERGLEESFIEYWKTLCSQNGRKHAPAYREFVRQFKAGAPIPGLPPGLSRRQLPTGYGYDNLMRHKPTAFETTAARIGRSAAADYRPKICTTRVGLHVGQRYLFDDMWHDFKIVTLGNRKPHRLLQLHSHDLFSACQFARGLKARIEDPISGVSVGLHEDEMLHLVAHVLTEFGFHPDGLVMMVEHGTAAIREWLEQIIFDLTGGKVTVDRSGIQGASAFAGQYPGRGKGNFRFKAALESLGNLIHNETANLLQFPGQTGSNSRINLPEELHGRERITDQLSLAMVALPSHVAMQLRLPFLEVNTAKWLVEEVMERINQRTDHELEGWLAAGLTTIDFAVPGVGIIPASAYLNLTPERRAAIEAVATPAPRKLSPREVFDSARGILVRFRPEQTAKILLGREDSNGKEVSVGDDHLITFEDEKVSPDPLRYLAHHFATGDKFRAVLNPWSPDTLHLFDARGAWVGQVKSWQTISSSDAAALQSQMGRAAKVEKELLAPLVSRGRELTQKRLDDSRHNTGVIRGDQNQHSRATGEQADLTAMARAALFKDSTRESTQ